MHIPDTVRTYLAGKRGKYSGRAVQTTGSFDGNVARAELPANSVAKTELVKCGKSFLMVVYPANRHIDFGALNRLFKRKFEPCTDSEIQEIFPNCDLESIPPVGEAYGVRVIQDRNLNDLDCIYFASGMAGLFLQTNREGFARLHEDSWRNYEVSLLEASDPAAGTESGEFRRQAKIKVQNIDKLPAMPGIASSIIPLRNNPYTSASELAEVIEQDPSLAAQLIRYALSPLYSYQGKVVSVEQAIVRVLGMDFVYDLAFGLALGKAFKTPRSGPLGLDAFWKQSVRTAALAQALCESIPFGARPPSGMAYLAGLVHDLGILLLGHLYPDQFRLLNTAVEQNPSRSMESVEQELVGVKHTDLGEWLMRAWQMPSEVVEAVAHHHDADYESNFSIYANLVYLANTTMAQLDRGEDPTAELDTGLLRRLHLTPELVRKALSKVVDSSEGLEFIARKMAA